MQAAEGCVALKFNPTTDQGVSHLEEVPMTMYRVKFLNHLLSSDGHEFKVLQRMIRVSTAKSCEDAVRCAQRRFSRLEHVDNWKLYADTIEVETEENDRGTPRRAAKS
jgi:hypothetical protein